MRDFKYIFSQNDPRWSRTLINNVSGATLGLYGCLVISWEMKANYYGHFLTPPQLAQILAQNALFTNGDFISSDEDLSKVFADIKYVSSHDYKMVPADLGLLKTLSDQGDATTVTLELDFDHNPNDGIQTHFVELHSYNGFSLRIYDPWDGREKDFTETYGSDPETTIQKFIVYSGTPNTGDITQITGNGEMMPVKVSDWKGLLMEAGTLESILPLFGFTTEDAKNQVDLGSKIKGKIVELQTALSTANQNLKVMNEQLTTPLPNPTISTPDISRPIPPVSNDSPAQPSLPGQPIPAFTPVQKNWFKQQWDLLFGKLQ